MTREYEIKNGCLKCGCGMKYHVSLVRPVLEAIARDAYLRGGMTAEEHIAAAIEVGYRTQHEGAQ